MSHKDVLIRDMKTLKVAASAASDCQRITWNGSWSKKNGNSKSRRKLIWTGPFERSRRHYRTISKNWIPPTQWCVGKSIVKFKPQKDVDRASLRLSHSLIKYFHPKSQFQSFTSPLIKILNFDKSLN